MVLTQKNILVSCLLILALGLSSWSIFLSNTSQAVVAETSNNDPDVFMDDVVAVVMNKLGTPSLKIETPKMTHYPQDDTTELLSPHVVVYRQSPQPWHINANHARTKQGVTEITFWDDVIIHHLADSDNPMTTMHTSSLTILPDKQVAKTNDAIVVNQPDTTIHGIGMLANWEEGTVQLLSQAREEYVPKS